MISKITGTIRAEYSDGEVQVVNINGRAVFFTVIAADTEDLPEGREAQHVALLGATNPTEFIERISDAVAETLEHLASDKVPAGVLYISLVRELAKSIAEKADDDDKELMDLLIGD